MPVQLNARKFTVTENGSYVAFGLQKPKAATPEIPLGCHLAWGGGSILYSAVILGKQQIIESQNGSDWKGPQRPSGSSPLSTGRDANHWIKHQNRLPIQLSLKHLQTWGAYNFSAQPTYVVVWLRSKMFSFTQTTRRAVLTGDIRIWVTGTDMTSYCPRIFACCLTKAYSTLNSLLSARLKAVFLTSQQTAGQSRWVHSTLPINNQSILDSLTLQLLPTACFCYHEEGRAPQPIS